MSPETIVPFVDLRAATAARRGAIDAAIAEILDAGWYVLGDAGRRFEAAFADWIGAEQAVGVASGTDAIEVALRGLGIGPGDEVVTQANTCVPTVAGIERTGAIPVLCDVDPEGAVMDPTSLAGALSPRTRAVVPVHLYGQCADTKAIRAVVEGRGIHVVEDCAQAHGAAFQGELAGTMGTAGAFSFYPTKNLGALGDGGAIVTHDASLAERLRSLRQYGQVDRYRHVLRGVNSRLDELQAAVLSVRLPGLEEANRRRAAIANAYFEALSDTAVRPLPALPSRRHVFHLFVVRTESRERLRAELAKRGVQTLIHYPIPVHRHEPYADLAKGPVSLKYSERLAREILSLPLYPEMSDAQVEHATHAAAEAAAST